MIIYFVDRQLNILGNASTSLPEGLQIVDDSTIEDAESGVNTFSCSIPLGHLTPGELEHIVRVGAYILKSSARSVDNSEAEYDSLYQIVETEYDTLNREIRLYAEDAGLDLLGRINGAVKLTSKTLRGMLDYFAPAGWAINCPTTNAKTHEWDGESTTVERLRSVAGLWGYDIYYSFDIDNFKVVQRNINVVKKRGLTTPFHKLYIGQEINSIVTKTSIADLATAYAVTGGIPKGAKTPINLKGYNYTYTDPKTGDVYKVHSATGQMRNETAMTRWATKLDKDGLILKRFSFDTTSKATLAGQARAALQKASQELVNYEVDFFELPEDVEAGDRIYVIDQEDELYLDARILQLETSASMNTKTAVLGEFRRKESAISDQLRESLQDLVNAPTTVINISLTKTQEGYQLSAELISGADVVVDADGLVDVFGEGAEIKWYKDDNYIGSGMSVTLESLGSIRTVYRCDLELVEEDTEEVTE